MGEHENGLAEAQKAIDLTPNFALAYFALGTIRVYAGRFDQVADPLQRAMRLSPHDPLHFQFYQPLALAQYHQGRYEEGVELSRTGLSIRPWRALYRTLVACHGQLGRADEARAALAEMRRLMPKNSEGLWEVTTPYVDPAHRAHLLDGLRKAGLPE
jgi:pentatricopeptide repeat protein